MLIAPKTLWAMMNLRVSVGGKYGANMHLSVHRRRRILQAAHGPLTAVGREAASLEEEEGSMAEPVVIGSVYSIFV